MSENYKIISKFIKDISGETPNVETYLYVKDFISKYQLNIEINSKRKLDQKNCDWIIANDISDNTIGFDSDDNEVSIFYKNKESEKLLKKKKSLIASEIVDRVISELN